MNDDESRDVVCVYFDFQELLFVMDNGLLMNDLGVGVQTVNTVGS